MSLFTTKAYKIVLRDSIQASGRKGYITELARAAGCTQSYLSQVIHGKPELTPDHALGISEFLNFNAPEAEYFLLLVQLSRASTPKLRAHLEEKLSAIADQQLRTEVAVETTNHSVVKDGDRDRYYASWIMPAVHILTASPEFQRADQISVRLGLPVTEINKILLWLLEKGIVRRQGERFVHSGQNIHLPTASIHNRLNHLNWRLKGLESSMDTEVIHYTSAFALNRADWPKLREHLLQFLERQRQEITTSGSEEAFVFCCDLFRV